jgi:hypothetical protein
VIDGEKVPDPDCPSPCVYTTYTYTVSQSEYPSSAVKDKVVEEVNKQKGTPMDEEDASSWTIERIRFWCSSFPIILLITSIYISFQ